MQLVQTQDNHLKMATMIKKQQCNGNPNMQAIKCKNNKIIFMSNIEKLKIRCNGSKQRLRRCFCMLRKIRHVWLCRLYWGDEKMGGQKMGGDGKVQGQKRFQFSLIYVWQGEQKSRGMVNSFIWLRRKVSGWKLWFI